MKRSASFYLGLFLIGILPLVALNCPSPGEKTSELLNGTWTVSKATGLPSFTFSGPTTITFTVGDPVTEGSFSVSGAANLPRIVENDEQVAFPSSGTYKATTTDNGNLTAIAITSGSTNLTLSVTAFDGNAGSITFTYPGAEPKASDLGTVTVTASK